MVDEIPSESRNFKAWILLDQVWLNTWLHLIWCLYDVYMMFIWCLYDVVKFIYGISMNFIPTRHGQFRQCSCLRTWRHCRMDFNSLPMDWIPKLGSNVEMKAYQYISILCYYMLYYMLHVILHVILDVTTCRTDSNVLVSRFKENPAEVLNRC